MMLTAMAMAGTPFGGVEWHPVSRDDLVWVDEGRTSGVAVGEFDGTVNPALSAYGGAWVSERTALSLSLGVARLGNTTYVNDVLRQVHWGVIRPGFDVRWSLHARRPDWPVAWIILGAHGDIPSARDVSNGFTNEEQEAADDLAKLERARLGGLGGRSGLGVEYDLLPGLSIGAQWALTLHYATWRSEDVSLVGQWMAADAALLLGFRWPKNLETK
jgi:hypothetical protein